MFSAMNVLIKLTKQLITVGAASLNSKVQQMPLFPVFRVLLIMTRDPKPVRHKGVHE